MAQDGVSVAFEVILEELNVVEAQLTIEGAEAFKSKRYNDAMRLGESGKQLLDFRGKLELLKDEWACGIDVETRKRVVIEPGYTIPAHFKNKKTNFKVTLSSGKIIYNEKASHTFAEVIEFFGLDLVRGLGVTLNGCPLIDIRQHEKYTTSKSGNYFIMTHCSTDAKRDLLYSIARRLGKIIEISDL